MNRILLLIVLSTFTGVAADLAGDSAATRAILDAGGLQQNSVWSVADTSGGRITRIILNAQLTQLSGRIGDLTALQNLYLELNRLTSLPDELARCTSLVRISLQNNQFSQFPQVLTALPHLSEVRLSYNSLSTLPDGIEKMPALTLLFCDSNLIESVPSSLCRSRTLQQLNLRLNKVTAIPDSIALLSQTLTILTLLGNRLESLPESIAQLDHITLFDVQSNRICSLGPLAGAWVEAHDPNWQIGQECPNAGVRESPGCRPAGAAASAPTQHVSSFDLQGRITLQKSHRILTMILHGPAALAVQ